MKILVTGAAGFIGSHCAEYFATQGHQVYGVDNFDPYYDLSLKKLNQHDIVKSGVVFIEADLQDDLSVKLPNDFDYVFHFAAQPGISTTTKFSQFVANNICATQNLLDWVCDSSPKLKLFINIATSSIYGKRATFPETTAAKPVSFYGVTKLAAEQLILGAHRSGKISACSLRLYSVYGPRERPEKLYTKLIKSIFEQTSFPLFQGSENHSRSFTYVGDVVQAMDAVIGKEDHIRGEIINVGTELSYTTGQGITLIEEIIGIKASIQMHPPRLGDQLQTTAIIDKARKLLGYNPNTSLKDGLTAQVHWYEEKFL